MRNMRTYSSRRSSGDLAAILAGIAAIFFSLALAVVSIAGWVTHVIVCIKTSAWILLLFGCIIAPVGVIHGVGVWFGIFPSW